MITKPLFAKKKCRFNAFIKSVSVHNIALKIQKNESGFPLMRGRNGFLNFFFYLVKIPLNQSPTVLPASSTCPLTSVSKGVSLSVARIRNSEALFPVQLAAICPTSNKILWISVGCKKLSASYTPIRASLLSQKMSQKLMLAALWR